MTCDLNRLARREAQLSQWHEALYLVLGQARLLAVPTAFLWAIWLWLSYGTEVPYLIYEVPFSVLACLLAASLCGSLLWRWYAIPK